MGRPSRLPPIDQAAPQTRRASGRSRRSISSRRRPTLQQPRCKLDAKKIQFDANKQNKQPQQQNTKQSTKPQIWKLPDLRASSFFMCGVKFSTNEPVCFQIWKQNLASRFGSSCFQIWKRPESVSPFTRPSHVFLCCFELFVSSKPHNGTTSLPFKCCHFK